MKKIYLAIPYSGIESLSYATANKVAAMLIAKGYCVFSPISHSHMIKVAGMDSSSELRDDYETWLAQDRQFVEWCDEVWVIDIINRDGLGLIFKSKGVQQEIEWAAELGKPYKLIKYHTETKELTL